MHVGGRLELIMRIKLPMLSGHSMETIREASSRAIVREFSSTSSQLYEHYGLIFGLKGGTDTL